MAVEDYQGYDDKYNLRVNNEYLPMANAGFGLTKNISIYAMNVYDSNIEYDDLVNQTTANIYKLNVIKKKVDDIVRIAKAERNRVNRENGVYVDPRCEQATENTCAGIKIDEKKEADEPKPGDIIPQNAPDTSCVIESFTIPPVQEGNPLKTRSLTGATIKLAVKPDTIVPLEWKTRNCNTVSASGIGTNLSQSGKAEVQVEKTTTYKLLATGTENTTAYSRTVYVENSPSSTCSITSFSAGRLSIKTPGSTILTWATKDCTSVYVSGGTPGSQFYPVLSQTLSGTIQVGPPITTEYKISASNGGNSASKSLIITVTEGPE